jgi:hypothetical protein
MKKFIEQLEINLKKDIEEFNNNPDLASIRELYKQNFNEIAVFIEKIGYKLAIEDISMIDRDLTKIVMDNFLLLKEINRAIFQQKFTFSDIR